MTGSGKLKRLTRSGFYHDITLDTVVGEQLATALFCLKSLHIFLQNFEYFLSVFSNASSKVAVSISPLAQLTQPISEWCSACELYFAATMSIVHRVTQLINKCRSSSSLHATHSICCNI